MRVPTLTRDDIVIMDNLGCHNVAGVCEAIEVVGATVKFLPAYSPDLSPIEMAFAKIQALLRAKALRTVGALWNALAASPTASRRRSAATSSAMQPNSGQSENTLTTASLPGIGRNSGLWQTAACNGAAGK